MNCPGSLTTLFSTEDYKPVCDFCARKFAWGTKVIPPHDPDPRQMPLDDGAQKERDQ